MALQDDTRTETGSDNISMMMRHDNTMAQAEGYNRSGLELQFVLPSSSGPRDGWLVLCYFSCPDASNILFQSFTGLESHARRQRSCLQRGSYHDATTLQIVAFGFSQVCQIGSRNIIHACPALKTVCRQCQCKQLSRIPSVVGEILKSVEVYWCFRCKPFTIMLLQLRRPSLVERIRMDEICIAPVPLPLGHSQEYS